MRRNLIAILAALTLSQAPANARTIDRPERSGFDIEILVDGTSLTEYSHRGTTYVEALRGREYEIRISNPSHRRAAVALAVDGLNTIDASRTDPRKARKWVIEPYSSVTISGWQVNDRAARRFVFTGERQSYGAFLGQTDNLGVIEAVFYLDRERRPPVTIWGGRERDAQMEKRSEAGAAGSSMPAPSSESKDSKGQLPAAAPQLADEYAATGMGDRTRHDVVRIDLDLESSPTTALKIRYEYRPQLVKLGVLTDRNRDPLARRERAKGFTGDYCPEPN
jgi:hypothetical protein